MMRFFITGKNDGWFFGQLKIQSLQFCMTVLQLGKCIGNEIELKSFSFSFYLNGETQVERVKDGIVRVRQSRYLIDSEKEGKGEESPYGYKWDIYLTYKTNNHDNEVKSKWFTSNDEFVQISVPSGKCF